MSNINSSSIPSVEVQEMLNGIAQWETPAVEFFLKEVNEILAKKKRNKLSKRETELFLIINKSVLNEEEWQDYRNLFIKFEEKSISVKEQANLDQYVKILEEYGIKRLEALIELAQIRMISLDDLMNQLGIQNITPDVTK